MRTALDRALHSLRAADLLVAQAAERVERGRVEAAVRVGRRRGRAATEDRREQKNRVGDVQEAVVVRVAGILARRDVASHGGREEQPEHENRVGDVDVAVDVAVSATEVLGRDAGVLGAPQGVGGGVEATDVRTWRGDRYAPDQQRVEEEGGVGDVDRPVVVRLIVSLLG